MKEFLSNLIPEDWKKPFFLSVVISISVSLPAWYFCVYYGIRPCLWLSVKFGEYAICLWMVICFSAIFIVSLIIGSIFKYNKKRQDGKAISLLYAPRVLPFVLKWIDGSTSEEIAIFKKLLTNGNEPINIPIDYSDDIRLRFPLITKGLITDMGQYKNNDTGDVFIRVKIKDCYYDGLLKHYKETKRVGNLY